jgi:hypothetical protein
MYALQYAKFENPWILVRMPLKFWGKNIITLVCEIWKPLNFGMDAPKILVKKKHPLS